MTPIGKLFFALAGPLLYGHSSLIGAVIYYGTLSLIVAALWRKRDSADPSLWTFSDRVIDAFSVRRDSGLLATAQMVICVTTFYGALIGGAFMLSFVRAPAAIVILGVALIVMVGFAWQSLRRLLRGAIREAIPFTVICGLPALAMIATQILFFQSLARTH